MNHLNQAGRDAGEVLEDFESQYRFRHRQNFLNAFFVAGAKQGSLNHSLSL